MKIGVFAGSFCPFTKGHEYIVSKALDVFDKIIIGIGINEDKEYDFDIETRIKWIEKIYENNPRVSVMNYSGLTVDFCRYVNAKYIIRGIRNESDEIFEKKMYDFNKSIADDIETVYFKSSEEFSNVSSTLVRELWKSGKDYSKYVSYELTLSGSVKHEDSGL